MKATLNRRLGVAGIVFMVIAAVALITVVAANFPIIFSVSGSVGAPTMILVATVILLLFSVGYAWMTPQVPGRGRLLLVRGPRPRTPRWPRHRSDRTTFVCPADGLDDLLPRRPDGQPARTVAGSQSAVVAHSRHHAVIVGFVDTATSNFQVLN